LAGIIRKVEVNLNAPRPRKVAVDSNAPRPRKVAIDPNALRPRKAATAVENHSKGKKDKKNNKKKMQTCDIHLSVSEFLSLSGYTDRGATVAKTIALVVAREKNQQQLRPSSTSQQRTREVLTKGNPTLENIARRAQKLLVTSSSTEQSLEIINVTNDLLQTKAEAAKTFRRKLSGEWGTVQVHGTCEVENGNVVVRKTRGTRLWKRVWPSDSAKLHVQLWITRSNAAKFIESCKNSTSTYTTGVGWNPDRWRDILQRSTPALLKIKTELT
jgi:hypothetical protein